MNIQYLTDVNGQKTAVLIPIGDWNVLQKKIALHDEDHFTLKELAEAESGWQECVAGKGELLEDVMKELLPEDRMLNFQPRN